MRLTTAFNRILQLPGASVRTVAFTDQGIVIGLRRLLCPCGTTTAARYDSSRRRWRHLDFGACQVWLEADIHRIDCRGCGRVRTEQVPWARGRPPVRPAPTRSSADATRTPVNRAGAARHRAAAIPAGPSS